jgi:RNase P subunit RPR2
MEKLWNSLNHPISKARRINFRENTTIMEAYCVKCKTKREMKDPKQIEMKNGKPAVQGTCPECGTKMTKIGASMPA